MLIVIVVASLAVVAGFYFLASRGYCTKTYTACCLMTMLIITGLTLFSTTSDATAYGVTITSPENEATIRNNSGTVHVRAKISSKLRVGHRLVLLVDDEAKSESFTGDFTLKYVDRGVHVLVVQIMNENDKIISRSDPIVIFLFRASIIQ